VGGDTFTEAKFTEATFTEAKFTEAMLTRPPVRGRDVEAALEHFAIVSYAVPPERVRPHVDPAFDLDCFAGPHGEPLVWVSMVAV